LRREYCEFGKSTKQIRDLNCSASTIAKYLLEVGIEPRAERLPRQRRGQIPFGMKLRKGQLVPHKGEQLVNAKLAEMREGGASFRQFVNWLNDKGIKTKNRAKRWDRPTVYKILKRQ